MTSSREGLDVGIMQGKERKSTMFHLTRRTCIAFVLCAISITLLSSGVARMGTGYRCDMYDSIEENRDARGMPFIYLQRSVQSTGCSPHDLNDVPIPNYGMHIFYPMVLVADVAFWFLILVLFRSFILWLEKQK